MLEQDWDLVWLKNVNAKCSIFFTTDRMWSFFHWQFGMRIWKKKKGTNQKQILNSITCLNFRFFNCETLHSSVTKVLFLREWKMKQSAILVASWNKDYLSNCCSWRAPLLEKKTKQNKIKCIHCLKIYQLLIFLIKRHGRVGKKKNKQTIHARTVNTNIQTVNLKGEKIIIQNDFETKLRHDS